MEADEVKQEIIRLYYEEHKRPSEIAPIIEKTPQYVSKIVNTHKGKSFIQYINDLRIEYAIIQLQKNNKLQKYTINALALEFGFNNAESFSTAFHKRTGLKPTYFIKELENDINTKDILKNTLLKIHKSILKASKESINLGMASTFTGMLIDNYKLKGIHTGDTRICILRGNGIKQITKDQTEVARLFREDFDEKLFACSSAEECESLFYEAMEVRLHLSETINRVMKECREKQDYIENPFNNQTQE